MQITLSPSRGLPGQRETRIDVKGDTITVDGTAYDLSAVPEAGRAFPDGEHPFIGPITRRGGEIACTVIARLGEDAAHHQPTDPAHWRVSIKAGTVTIPAERIIEPEDAA